MRRAWTWNYKLTKNFQKKRKKITSFAIHLFSFFFFSFDIFFRKKSWIGFSQLSDTKARVKECNRIFYSTKTKSKSVKLFCKVMVVLNVLIDFEVKSSKWIRSEKKLSTGASFSGKQQRQIVTVNQLVKTMLNCCRSPKAYREWLFKFHQVFILRGFDYKSVL